MGGAETPHAQGLILRLALGTGCWGMRCGCRCPSVGAPVPPRDPLPGERGWKGLSPTHTNPVPLGTLPVALPVETQRV